jgi:hypothetical protein
MGLPSRAATRFGIFFGGGELTTESTEKGEEQISHNGHNGHNEKQKLKPLTTEA